MKKVKLIILIALICVKSDGFSILKDKFSNAIIGISWSPKNNAKIEIYSKGQDYYGNLVWLKSSKSDTRSLDFTSLKLSEYVGISLFGHTETFEIITKK